MKVAPEGFFDEVLTFESDPPGLSLFAVSERGAQFFYPGILPTLYNANMRVI